MSVKHSMVITPNQELLIMTNDKTIDDRGVRVHVAYSVGDGIGVFVSTNIWLDHLSMFQCDDGLIDVIQASTVVTISNCHFTDHNDVMLFGAHDNYDMVEKMQITVALNYFGKGLVVQRMPRCRFGFIHVVNNDYTNWLMYTIGGSNHPMIISQRNRYFASSKKVKKELTKRDYVSENEWKKWDWRSEGDLFTSGAFFVKSENTSSTKKFGPDKMIPYKSGETAPIFTKNAEALNCVSGKPC